MKHSIRAEIEVRFHLPGMPEDERETAYPVVDIDFTFLPGAPERGPTYACGGTPADPAEIEMVKATLVNGDGLVPTQDRIDDWADAWLQGVGFDRACDVACERDYERDEVS
jgi:hypothetical protein